MTRFAALLRLFAALLFAFSGPWAASAAESAVTAATIDAWASELSNHGRWGEDDQRGTLNLIVPIGHTLGSSYAVGGHVSHPCREASPIAPLVRPSVSFAGERRVLDRSHASA